MMATLRHLTELDAGVRAGRWSTGVKRLYELWSSTIGIVGMGRIGQEVTLRLRGWGATLVYYDPVRLTLERERDLGVAFAPLDELLARADVLTVHVPLSAATRHLIDGRALALMKPTAVVVNTSRGELVDESALAKALHEGRLGGAGFDVLSAEPPPSDHPLLSTPNTLLTPHMAGPTWQSWPRRFGNAYANIARVQRGEPPGVGDHLHAQLRLPVGRPAGDRRAHPRRDVRVEKVHVEAHVQVRVRIQRGQRQLHRVAHAHLIDVAHVEHLQPHLVHEALLARVDTADADLADHLRLDRGHRAADLDQLLGAVAAQASHRHAVQVAARSQRRHRIRNQIAHQFTAPL